MKKKLFCALIVSSLFITSFTSLSEDLSSNIQVHFNSIKVKVNGKNTTSDNILYNGRTYIQLRDVADMLDKNIEWDDKTKTANITDKVTSLQTNINDMKQFFIYTNTYKELYDLARDIEKTESALYYDLVQISALNIKSETASKQILEYTSLLSNKVDFINKNFSNSIEYSYYQEILLSCSNALLSYTYASNRLADYYFTKSKSDNDYNLYLTNLEEGRKHIKQAIKKSNVKYLDYSIKLLK